MDPYQILKDGWRITWRTWQIWALMALQWIIMIPGLILGGGIGAGLAASQIPQDFNPPEWLPLFQNIPVWIWISLWIALLVVEIPTMLAGYGLQAASMRIVIDAAEGRTVSVRGALHLGSRRWVNILKLILTIGVPLFLLAFLPIVLMIFFAHGSIGNSIALQIVQLIESPVNIALGFLLMLLLLAISLEELSYRDTVRRAWKVFRWGWWCFLLVFVVNMGVGVVFALFLMPLICGGSFLAVIAPQLIPVLLGGVCFLCSPIGFACMVFLMVFVIALYTLTYRTIGRMIQQEEKRPA